MSTDEHQVPVPPPNRPVDPVISAGMEIALRWGEVLDPERLSIALRALEPQMKREHQARMAQIDMDRAAAERADAAAQAEGERTARALRERRAHARYMAGLTVGAIIAVIMLGAGVYVAAESWWLSLLLCGPSLLALAKVFVLRRSDPDDLRLVTNATRNAMGAAGQAQPPVPPMML